MKPHLWLGAVVRMMFTLVMENKISERDEEQENKATSAERSRKDLIKWRKQYKYKAAEKVKEKMQNLSLFTRNLDQ